MAERKDARLQALVGSHGYSATVLGDGDWRKVGTPLKLTRGREHESNTNTWPAKVVSHGHAKRLVVEWHLKSGERRTHVLYAEPDEAIGLGGTIEVRNGRNDYTATVVESSWATKVKVAYHVNSSPEPKYRTLYGDHELDWIAQPLPDGKMSIGLPAPPVGHL